MKEIKAVTNFTLNGVYYEKGDIVKVETIEDLIKLNEKGFIEPLTAKEIQNFGKKPKKEEE